ncbi:hypothetical protein [Cognaticolwellia mytili]|uniref:hypothetical protein n=1 Tax=Cognaticolwellia mytili TaxID=1888913 RepID=UPI001F42DE3D|nr:hypothetical protein [Cognaticolwellia mytili]
MTKTYLSVLSGFLLLLTTLLFSQEAAATAESSLAKESVPEILTPWLPWVMKGNEHFTCPFINRSDFNKKQNHVCAWPSTLNLAVQNTSATFQQSWQVLANSFIPLPGNSKNWPLSVKVNRQYKPVVLHQGKPAIELEKGRYNITGQFNWPKIPESISIPNQYAFVQMTLNDRVVVFPKIENNELWLQALEPNQKKRDSVELYVARRVADGSYIEFDTYLSLNVSGKMREVILGEVLPKGVELIGIESKLSAFLDADGLLHAKLKPGSWQILVRGYAKPALLEWQRPQQSHVWPKDEIWVFKGDESLRLGKLSGASMVDNTQAEMPDAWYELPSYLLRETDVLSYEIQHRGKPLHVENQLALNRTLWLSFDSSNYTFSDHITGEMISDWRLSMNTPYMLESAEDQDGSVLITSQSADERGLENRYPGINLSARGVFEADSNIAISGWQSNFERVSLTLNLPPGNKLFAVFGADSVSNSWWGNWSIWASFIVLLSAFIASRLVSVSAGVITGLMLIVTYQETGVPLIAIGNFLLAIAIKKHQPFTSLKSIVNSYWAISIAIAVGSILFFSATQLRTVIHPQLEAHASAVESFDRRSQMDMNVVTEMIQSKTAKQAYSAMESVEQIEVTGSKIKKADLLMERYQTDALIQAGSGIPNWQWNAYQINWHSPVAENQMFDVIVLSKNSYRVVKIAGVLLSLMWLILMLKDLIKPRISDFRAQALTVILAMFVLFPGASVTTEAAEFPQQQLLNELKQRVLAAPNCAPSCALINQLTVDSEEKSLQLTLVVHANADTAVALPRSEFWRPEKLLLNGKPINSLLKRGAWIYIPASKGISTFTLLGKIAPVDTFQLEFKDIPQYIEVNSSRSWQVVGSQANSLSGNSLAFLSIIKEKTVNNETTLDEGKVSSTRYSARPFVKVTRELSIDQIWTLKTTVERIAPSTGSINTRIATLAGEHVISADILLENGQVEVTLPAGKNQFIWRSTIDRQQLLSLYASPESALIEQWQVIVSPSWHAEISGLPMILAEQKNNDYFSYLFYPYPGETLTISTTRPKAVKGDVLAIDRVKYEIEQGTRASKLKLSFDYRSTRGGEHIIDLPQNYQLKEIKTDSKLINLQLEQGKLAIPILPGRHNIQILMRANIADQLVLTAPIINLNAPISNITSAMNLTRQRWVLWADGPVLGPAVLYWGELLVFIFLALLVARVPFSPLTTISWIALGFGLSLNNWGILMLVAVWFASLTASTYRPKTLNRNAFNFSQLLLYGLSIITLLSLLAAIPTSLLSSPDMGITGNNSYGNYLQWFADKSEGLLPEISVISVPILFYKGLMLAWVIWLSFSGLNWMKWAWSKLGSQGYWQAKEMDTAESKVSKKAN